MGSRRRGALPELAPYPGQADRALRLVRVRRRRAFAVALACAGAIAALSLLVTASGRVVP